MTSPLGQWGDIERSTTHRWSLYIINSTDRYRQRDIEQNGRRDWNHQEKPYKLNKNSESVFLPTDPDNRLLSRLSYGWRRLSQVFHLSLTCSSVGLCIRRRVSNATARTDSQALLIDGANETAAAAACGSEDCLHRSIILACWMEGDNCRVIDYTLSSFWVVVS